MISQQVFIFTCEFMLTPQCSTSGVITQSSLFVAWIIIVVMAQLLQASSPHRLAWRDGFIFGFLIVLLQLLKWIKYVWKEE